MHLIVPYAGELEQADAHLIRLAEFLGIHCEAIPLDGQAAHSAGYLERVAAERRGAFVLNPRTLKRWASGNEVPAGLIADLASHFSHLLLHSCRPDPFDSKLVALLSQGALQSVRAAGGAGALYEVRKDTEDICGEFSGLAFGPANPANDRVFVPGSQDAGVRALISIAGLPFLAAMKREGCEILFLGSDDVADLGSEVGDAPLDGHFSRLVPQTMALRRIFGRESWRPCGQRACIIVDDPLLRKNYGFLNLESLLRLAQQHNFHAAVAFIPHNFRRSSQRIARMFRENPSRLSICFHGNDHTGGEFASTDTGLLSAMLQIAQRRMDSHRAMTGLACDRVMVFPQGNFSEEAMQALRSQSFDAAVNTVPHPAHEPARLTLGELLQPAVLRYGGFPLFLRKPVRRLQSQDIAFDLFFGKPVLIVEHHDAFQHPESLAEIADRINALAPAVRWCNLARVASESILRRRAPDGTYQVRAYSNTVRISNTSRFVERFWIEWNNGGRQGAPADQVLKDGIPCPCFDAGPNGIRLSVEMAPGSSQNFSVVYRNGHPKVRSLGIRWNTKAFVRRRLSEVRDNYLSKNQRLLEAAKALQRTFLPQ